MNGEIVNGEIVNGEIVSGEIVSPALWIANLDAETELTRGRRSTLPEALRVKLAALGTLLRVFADEEDRLALLASCSPDRMGEVPGIPRPRTEVFSQNTAPPAGGRVIAWCETPSVARLRVASPPPTTSAPTTSASAPTPECVRRVHGRSFCLDLARRLGCSLPGAAMVETPDDLKARVARFSGPWVVKAQWSAAGRDRHVETGAWSAGLERRLEKLFRAHGPLLLEPWLDRRGDYGALGRVEGDEIVYAGSHLSLHDPRGAPRGFELATGGTDHDSLRADEARLLRETVLAVGRALRAEGFTGPFGVDAWRRTSGGETTLHPLGEINARHTFGWVARALLDRRRQAGGIPDVGVFRLWLTPPPSDAREILLRPAEDDPTGAWIETRHDIDRPVL